MNRLALILAWSVALAGAAVALGGCGQAGPLYLPRVPAKPADDPPAVPVRPADAATDAARRSRD